MAKGYLTPLNTKLYLMDVIVDIMNKRALTQQELARILNVTQPRVSAICTKKAALFSIDTLIKMLSILGRQVKITIAKEHEG